MERRKRCRGTGTEAISGSLAAAGFDDGPSTTDFFVTVCIVTILRFLLHRLAGRSLLTGSMNGHLVAGAFQNIFGLAMSSPEP